MRLIDAEELVNELTEDIEFYARKIGNRARYIRAFNVNDIIEIINMQPTVYSNKDIKKMHRKKNNLKKSKRQ